MIGLFLGVETYNWQQADFDKAIQFCLDNKVDQLVLKVYEVTQGWWYRNYGPNGAGDLISYIQSKGLDVLPYGFFYDGSHVELTAMKQGLAWYGKFCLNMESSFDNKPDNARAVSDGLKGHSGTLYVSTWANPVTHGWTANIDILDPIVDVWMPEVYDDNLVKEMYSQFNKVTGKIWPTFHVSQTNALLASPFPDFTLWEYQDALKYPNLLKQYVQLDEGKQVSYPTNSQGMVANYVPVTEFQPGRSEFECGAFAVALNGRAENYNKPNTNSAANLISWAEDAYFDTTGSNGPSNTAGASIDNMHTMLKWTQDPHRYTGSGPLHWWDISSIGPNSTQSNDIGQIKAALEHGYPVIATVTEASVFDVDLGRNPYWWGPSGNHILTWVGIAPDGNLLAVDPANVIRGDGNLQTPKQVQSWPRKYDIKRIANLWATIIQPSWLPPIPSANPLSWPPYTPPAPPPPDTMHDLKVVYDLTSKQIMFLDGVTVVYRISL